MGFIEAYKQLEKLCGEVLDDDRCVSAYIDEMINNQSGAYLVKGWSDDLKQLKHYRWVRNQIVHEPNRTEQNMCAPNDTEWLKHFYSRIMNQNDPLALYAKAVKGQAVNKSSKMHTVEAPMPVSYRKSPKHKKNTINTADLIRNIISTGLFIIAIIAIILLLLSK